jgi:hypothetical protein
VKRKKTDNTMVKRYQRGNQKPWIERRLTIQWSKDTKGVIRSRESKEDWQYNGQNIPSIFTLFLDLLLYCSCLCHSSCLLLCMVFFGSKWLHESTFICLSNKNVLELPLVIISTKWTFTSHLKLLNTKRPLNVNLCHGLGTVPQIWWG